MAVQPDTTTGTLTTTEGSVLFTTSGTYLLTREHMPGDRFLVNGLELQIATITGENSGTLTEICPPDAAVTAFPVRLRFQPDGARVAAQTRNLIDLLGNGNLLSLASIDGQSDQIPIFIGPNSFGVINRTDLVNGAAYDVQVDTLSDRAAYDGQLKGFAVLVSDIGDGRSALYSKRSDASGDWTDPAYVTSKARVAVVVWDSGNPASGELVWQNIFDTEITFYQNFMGSYAHANFAPVNNAVYKVQKNGVDFGTITFEAGENDASFISELTIFNAGDIISIIAPNPRDIGLAEIAITLAGSR